MAITNEFIFRGEAGWIWCEKARRPYNNYVCFRRSFELASQPIAAMLQITADSRYVLYVNGQRIGHGPARSWPSPWPVDEYELREHLRAGRNAIAVLVQHLGLSTMQYLHADPGLLAQLRWTDESGEHGLYTDPSWRCQPHEGFAWPVPRASLPLAWEEQFDASSSAPDNAWMLAAFNDSQWPAAQRVRRAGQPPHERFERRDIPMLTCDPAQPVGLISAEAVRPAPYTWSLLPREYINRRDKSANIMVGRVLLATHIHSPVDQEIQLHDPHRSMWDSMEWKINGQLAGFEDRSLQHTDSGVSRLELRQGWNMLMGRMHDTVHLCRAVLNIWTEQPVRFSTEDSRIAAAAGSPWLLIGPFALDPSGQQINPAHRRGLVEPDHVHPEATDAVLTAVWERGTLTSRECAAPWVSPLNSAHVAAVDVFATCSSERRVEHKTARIDQPTALLRDDADWTTIHPVDGADVRLLLDFGQEIVGFQELELDAPRGAIVDVHNFEFIQPDGRINLTEGMNNSFRYVCRQGIQQYRTVLRRGFRYCWLSFRRFDQPIRIRLARAIVSRYPATNAGNFSCSDPLLERIWKVGAESVRCCSEDTYVDCPSYEQAHWVGDARNEAMVDLVINGDARLSRHCWLQVGKSLDRSPITESHVPSGWINLLPAWSFLWMRWAQEHYWLTGNEEFAAESMPYLERNVEGIEKHLNDKGLFEITGWNMFDWAPMDTPSEGVVTHQNCLAVLGLRQAAQLAESIGRSETGRRWRNLGSELADAINEHLWCKKTQAYIDSIHSDGRRSEVFSQQTQTVAYIAEVAQGERAAHCQASMNEAPGNFVKAGSPFFMFFVLEGLVREGRLDRMIDVIRSYWGRQIEAGATTFWETYVEPNSSVGLNGTSKQRLTRSHCHGWSAAPTFFVTQHVLGVRPAEAGYRRVIIAPHPGLLRWASGTVPTPHGPVRCSWSHDEKRMRLQLSLPPGVIATVQLPMPGEITILQATANRQVTDNRPAIDASRPPLETVIYPLEAARLAPTRIVLEPAAKRLNS